MKKCIELYKTNRAFRLSFIFICNAAIIILLVFSTRYIPPVVSCLWNFSCGILKALSPLFLGLAIAYVVSPLVRFIEERFLRRFFFAKKPGIPQSERTARTIRVASTFIAYALLLLALLAIGYAFAIMFAGSLRTGSLKVIAMNTYDYVIEMAEDVREWCAGFADGILLEVYDEFMKGVGVDANGLLCMLTDLADDVTRLFLALIISIYVLSDSRRFYRLWKRLLRIFFSPRASAFISETLSVIDEVVSNFIKGAAIDGAIVAVISSAVLSLLNLDFAIFIGIFAGIANVIPYFGAFFTMIPAFLIGYITGGFSYALLIVGTIFVIQQIDGDLIYPKVVGNTIGLHPLYIFLAVTIGGHYFGLWGMIIAVPAAGVLKVFVSQALRYMAEKP